MYRFDTQSFLNYYNKVFTNVALERITGINQKLLHHYATGLKKPREPQRKKIEIALHKLGSELLAAQKQMDSPKHETFCEYLINYMDEALMAKSMKPTSHTRLKSMVDPSSSRS